MANFYHNDRLIISYALLNPSTKQWSGGAEITWKQNGDRRSHTIGGVTEQFKSAEDAERYVTDLAKAWIDANP